MYEIPPHLRPLNRRAEVRVRLLLTSALLGWLMVALWVITRHKDSLPLLVVVMLSGTAGLTALAPMLLRRLRGVARLGGVQRLTKQGVDHLAAGEAAEALMAFEQAARLSREVLPLWHALSVHNVGVALLRAGEPERAVALIEVAWASGAMDALMLRRQRDSLQAMRAVAYAVAGQLEEAEQALLSAQLHRSKVHPGRVMLAEGLVAARQESALAVTELGAQWEQAERDLSPIQRRALRLLLAFMVHRSGGPEAAITQWLGGLQPMPAGCLDYLAVRWPELHEFMQARSLLRQQQPEQP